MRTDREGQSYADFSFLEDGKEVFAIGCSDDYEEYATSYRCFDGSAFKKRGRWATSGRLLIALSTRRPHTDHQRAKGDEKRTQAI